MGRKNIRDFDCIRDVIEHIYTYGFYTREDFIKNDVVGSPRAYDDIVRQLRDLYFMDINEASALEEDTENRGKYKCYKFRRDYFLGVGDHLAAAYGLHAIKDDVVLDTVRCLSLAVSNQGTVASRIASLYLHKEGESRESSIRRQLKDLVSSRFLTQEGKRFFMTDPFTSLSDDELISLYYFVSFYAGAGYPRMPAVFLRETLRRHIAFRKLPPPVDAFLFRDNACGNVFDEQIVYELLRCCRDKSPVEVTLHGRRTILKPVFLKIDTKLGRWYLFAVRDEVPLVIRVSNIKKVTPCQDKFNYDQAESQINNAFKFSYVASAKEPTSKPIHVEAELHFENPLTRLQFEREMLIGRIEQRGGKESYCADVGELSELRPFLRSYGAYIRVLPSEDGQHMLDKELRNEYERMLVAYGTV